MKFSDIHYDVFRKVSYCFLYVIYAFIGAIASCFILDEKLGIVLFFGFLSILLVTLWVIFTELLILFMQWSLIRFIWWCYPGERELS